MKKRRIRWILALIPVLLAAVLVLTNAILKVLIDHSLTVTTYTLSSEKLTENVRIAFLTDLHNNDFGDDNVRLIYEIASFDPDIIVMGGDMVNRDTDDLSTILSLCERLLTIADIYYIYGNHEGVLEYAENGFHAPIDRELLNLGVHVFYGGVDEIVLKEDTLSVWTVPALNKKFDDDPAVKAQADAYFAGEEFKLVLSHYPDVIWDRLAERSFDLGLSGHYHGGQIILFGRGLYHMDTGLFPQYSGGKYILPGGGTFIVSRGLGNHIPIARINNSPELVLIDINSGVN